MSRGTSELPQDDSSSDWNLNKIEEIRRLLQESDKWPESGDQLLIDLTRLTSPSQTDHSGESREEDIEMLSIVVNDALSGIDVMKKYPDFYARILVDEELRTAFLDSLELLEQSRAGELLQDSGTDPIDISFLRQMMSKPTIRKSIEDRWVITWQRSVEQLQNMFFLAHLEPDEIYRSDEYLLEENFINILHSQVQLDDQELEVRLDAVQTVADPDNFDLMLVIFYPEEFDRRFEVTVSWGEYQQKAEVDQYGLAKFPPLPAKQIYSDSGKLIHDFELELKELN